MKIPNAETLFIMTQGHCASEPRRSEFITQVLAFADLDSYPRRADFMKAFSPGGTRAERQREAEALAHAAYLDIDAYKFAARRAKSKFPWPEPKSEFVRTFLTYGGGFYAITTEQHRLAFCNWLLVECMQEFPHRDAFVQHFSAGGDIAERQRIAELIESDGCILMSDIVDAAFQCARIPDRLVNYAGEDGVR